MSKVPNDEILLAEIIAAAKARGLGWTRLALFRDARGNACSPRLAVKCCAEGAMILAGRARFGGSEYAPSNTPSNLLGVSGGNDSMAPWWGHDSDDGESLGYAFRCAMEDE